VLFGAVAGGFAWNLYSKKAFASGEPKPKQSLDIKPLEKQSTGSVPN